MWSFNSRAQLRLIVSSPHPAQGLQQAMAPLTPELLEALHRLGRDANLSELSPELFAHLLDLGLIVPTDQLSEPIWFEPELERPVRLAQEAGTVFVPPAEPLPGWPDGLLPPNSPTLWPQTGPPTLSLPFVPEPQTAELIRRLQAGELQVAELPPALKAQLIAAGFLQSTDTQSEPWSTTARQARESLIQNGYAVVRGLLSPQHIAALRSYIRELSLAGYFEHADEQVLRRNTIYNHPLLYFLHPQINDLLAPIVPEPVQPSYSILALYHGGAELPRHLDRIQCAWNVSLVFDLEPEPPLDQLDQAWPLCFEQGAHVHQVHLGLGDLVVYSGTHTPHWRPPLPRGHRAVVGLFHFVAGDFRGKKL